ncbi:hypothetical protein [Flagellimonas sp.]|uniref:hypothetical protein n=1 Tax=Flagellimonas sp. TaxID=2058762 RepID=UPI003BB03380
MPMTDRVFKEVETLFVDKTCLGLDGFDEGPWEFHPTHCQGSVREVERPKAMVS